MKKVAKKNLYEIMVEDVYEIMGQFPASSIDPRHEYAISQLLKDLWKKSRRRELRCRANKRR